MAITGDPSSELQQYLHLEGQPSVGMSITWKGFFITFFSFRQGIFVVIGVMFLGVPAGESPLYAVSGGTVCLYCRTPEIPYTLIPFSI